VEEVRTQAEYRVSNNPTDRPSDFSSSQIPQPAKNEHPASSHRREAGCFRLMECRGERGSVSPSVILRISTKSQVPKNKQGPKNQIPNSEAEVSVRDLSFGACLESGFCDL